MKNLVKGALGIFIFLFGGNVWHKINKISLRHTPLVVYRDVLIWNEFRSYMFVFSYAHNSYFVKLQNST